MSDVAARRQDLETMDEESREAIHREAEGRVRPFKYEHPDALPDNGRRYLKLASTELVGASVQILAKGGENNLHYHSGEDGFWMVLRGRVRFHGPDGPIGEYGPYEGLIMPHNARYWFEAVTSAGELEILHVAGRRPRDNRRINVGPRTKRGVWIDSAGRSLQDGS